MRHFRSFRGSRSRSMRPVVQSMKMVINTAEATFTPGFQTDFIAQGVDSIAAGQASSIAVNVPTGSIIKYFEVQFAVANVVEAACFVNCTIQYSRSNQGSVDPDAVGGTEQRNQVLHQDLFSVGGFQNSTHKFKFKVPKQFQRLQEGMDWRLVWSNSATIARKVQIIYKFYR